LILEFIKPTFKTITNRVFFGLYLYRTSAKEGGTSSSTLVVPEDVPEQVVAFKRSLNLTTGSSPTFDVSEGQTPDVMMSSPIDLLKEFDASGYSPTQLDLDLNTFNASNAFEEVTRDSEFSEFSDRANPPLVTDSPICSSVIASSPDFDDLLRTPKFEDEEEYKTVLKHTEQSTSLSDPLALFYQYDMPFKSLLD